MVSALWVGDYPDNVPPAPDLKYAYLRVDFDDRPPGMMVLGYRDPDDVEVWYSSTQQAFKMQRGRLVSVLGMSDNWTAVRFSPEVPDLTQGLPTPVHYRRSRDEMPGYRYGVADMLTAERWAGQGLPPVRLPRVVPEAKARGWTWFRERSEGLSEASALPASWYAVGQHRGERTVVFSQQCMREGLCIRFTRWPLLD